MADYTGALKFPDGTTLLFSLQGTTNTALRQLFTADEQVLHEKSAQFALRKQEAAVRIAQAFLRTESPLRPSAMARKRSSPPASCAGGAPPATTP